ncbi:TPA: asparagine synthase (glutamine-hydrolyzing) [Candidatus Poribacteria bacterium]|nr:asparagine synthase (glutamine-hydrolyzing) [Candidatus Poribacteria bacterium]HEX29403.1 asparagine synthase (glutamine-hydrolyzing) [Candidatus Poribacteria bacterium]
MKREINHQAMDCYLSFQCVPPPMTIFRDIHQLPPAHMLIYTPQKLEVREYWDVHLSDHPHHSESQYIQNLEELIHESVKMRLISDVPLGAFLSGGIDSSVIVYNMTKAMSDPALTFSIGFTEERFSELKYARMISSRLKTRHSELIVEPKAIEVLPKLVWHFDEPFADSSAIPTYYVSKITREHVTVALSGDGGDELFAGYQRRYYLNVLEDKFRRVIPDPVRHTLIAFLAQIYPKADWLPRFLRFKYSLSNISMELERAYFHDRSTFRPELKDKLYHPDLKEVLGDFTPYLIFDHYFSRARSNDLLSRILYVDLKTYLPNDLLVKVDRMSMANSLEVRSPFLDHKFIEFAMTIPSYLKLNGKTSKYILRRYLQGKVPQEIIDRGKMGFSIPLSLWLKNDLRDMVEDVLFSRNARERGYFRYEYIRKMWNHHLKGMRDFSVQLWTLLMLELWHQMFV